MSDPIAHVSDVDLAHMIRETTADHADMDGVSWSLVARDVRYQLADGIGEARRERLLGFLDGLQCRFEHRIGNGYWTGLRVGLNDLTTAALERIAAGEVRRFWSQRKHDRLNRAARAA